MAARERHQCQGAQTAVEPLEQGVHVRQGHHARSGLVLMEKEYKKLRVQNAGELLDVLIGLALGKGRKSPVFGPGNPVDFQHGPDVFLQGGLAGSAAGKTGLRLEPGHFRTEP